LARRSLSARCQRAGPPEGRRESRFRGCTHRHQQVRRAGNDSVTMADRLSTHEPGEIQRRTGSASAIPRCEIDTRQTNKRINIQTNKADTRRMRHLIDIWQHLTNTFESVLWERNVSFHYYYYYYYWLLLLRGIITATTMMMTKTTTIIEIITIIARYYYYYYYYYQYQPRQQQKLLPKPLLTTRTFSGKTSKVNLLIFYPMTFVEGQTTFGWQTVHNKSTNNNNCNKTQMRWEDRGNKRNKTCCTFCLRTSTKFPGEGNNSNKKYVF